MTTARREARTRGIDPAEELLRYAVHGLLHLFGHDDRTPAARRRMWARQETLIRRICGKRVSPPSHQVTKTL
jgi:rRNA maturation RNase YbeY